MHVTLAWATPDGDTLLGYMARVSNPKAKAGDDSVKLIRFLIEHNHWSPFDMVNLCVQITTTRDIGRQILRHWSIHPQEFSQRYAVVQFDEILPREMRLKGTTNRQGSLEKRSWFFEKLAMVSVRISIGVYNLAIRCGVSAESARAVLPEGYTPTRMFLNGTVRSWIHYLQQRLDSHAQKEHREIAREIFKIFVAQFPTTAEAVRW